MGGNRFRCFLIGVNNLLIECGQILVEKGHRVLGVVSDTPRISRWAREKGISVWGSKADYRTAMAGQDFDYLFSITNFSVIPQEILALPRQGAVNFHDGPLPNYAGLNTPVWALLNGETRYGITWHEMTAEVDRGRILKQVMFDLVPGETSLSLNTRCFQAGIEGFRELVDELANGTVRSRVQDRTAYHYFGKHLRPPAACVLDWNQPAEDLVRVIRALYFGPYENPVGVPKARLGERVLLVTQAIAGDAKPPAPVGAIVACRPDAVEVATGNGVLALQEVQTLNGVKISPGDFAERWGLEPGKRFEALTPDLAARLTDVNKRLCKSEPHWVRRLAKLRAPELPPGIVVNGEPGPEETIPLKVPAEFGENLQTIAAFCAFWSRLSEGKRIYLGYSDPSVTGDFEGLETLVATQVPLTVKLAGNLNFGTFTQAVKKGIDQLRQRGPWLRDAVARYPELQKVPQLRSGRPFPIAITQGPASEGNLLRFEDSQTDGCRLHYDSRAVPNSLAATLVGWFNAFFENLSAQPQQPLMQLSLLSPKERQKVLVEWNQTAGAFPAAMTVHRLFENQAARTPNTMALSFEDRGYTYAELDERSSALARELRARGLGPDRLAGIFVQRSLDLLLATLATMKAAAGYVPLDPDYPRERIAYMIEDSSAPVLITQAELADQLPPHQASVVLVDRLAETGGAHGPCAFPTDTANAAYVIYTSGSTGKPKGVVVPHQTVVNFFHGMDGCIPHDPPGVWLAVTSLSFDISVLELFWTLARGFHTVLFLDRERELAEKPGHAHRPMAFSLFYFSSDENMDPDQKYRLLLEGAKYGDRHDFTAVWTPERHFHDFGGLYPNPAITGAAVAAITEKIQIRAGSVVLPLHHPVRVAEAWSVVDNLSGGRVAISIASGWQPNDFILRPENYADAKKAMFRDAEIIQRLWRGEAASFPGAIGATVEVRTHPRPVQKELPLWVTTAGNVETYIMAGEIGANILTHLLGQSVDDLKPKIAAYRQARAESGHDPDAGVVSLMLHTFVGESDDAVRDLVREPLKKYLGTSLNLLKKYAWAFPAFTRPKDVSQESGNDFENLTEEEHDALLNHAFERYFETSGLFGTPETCMRMVDALKAISVNEIACLIDFGVPTDHVLESLPRLNRVKDQANRQPARVDNTHGFTLPDLIRTHGVTHLQCTPSMARMMLLHDETRAALPQIPNIFIGGEAFPGSLAAELREVATGTITNMYGPTETTIWSSTHVLAAVDQATVPIGKPIANTQLYVLDGGFQPVPVGMPGELFIAGDGVVRGYFGRPDLTADRFLPDPFTEQRGARMYRTGDRTHFRDDGSIAFLGRVDHQVKIRGFRIEPGEIESYLQAHPRVRTAVVIVREDTPGDPRLVAYLEAEGPPPPAEAFQEHLRAHLPEHMVPAHFEVMDALPLTPNRKLDRSRLPAPGKTRARSKVAYAPPENDLEASIAQLWQELLGRDKVGANDNFFDIGGHSLLVVQMHRKLSRLIEQSVELTDLYRFTTIRGLTQFIASGGGSESLKKSADRAQRRLRSMKRRRRGARV